MSQDVFDTFDLSEAENATKTKIQIDILKRWNLNNFKKESTFVWSKEENKNTNQREREREVGRGKETNEKIKHNLSVREQ